ncbi:uncharacterized protein LOC105190620 [Harpegnathos saltator]|uniref:Uncharacterized protein n=1 Tax=Harpegnathos saltator TaxID=610380 RepID=E2C6T3_HARSA|nr:uncharacterized protein LOC105190620 [Harpegnathos saltator]EFN76347.1 hypothetical protein EAI_08012 [Harpegnathos saltator]
MPQVYRDTLIHCKKDNKIVGIFGEPIKIIRQKNRIVHSHRYYKVKGESYEEFTFDIAGPKAKGLVHANVKKVNNEYEYTNLHVTVSKVGRFKVESKVENLRDRYKYKYESVIQTY